MIEITWLDEITEKQKDDIWSWFKHRGTVRQFINKLQLLLGYVFTSTGTVKEKGWLQFKQLIIAKAALEVVMMKANVGDTTTLFTDLDLRRLHNFQGMIIKQYVKLCEINAFLGYPAVPLTNRVLHYEVGHGEEVELAEGLEMCTQRFEKILINKEQQVEQLKRERKELYKIIDELNEKVRILELKDLHK
ncbi:hypothetical protein PP175_01570 [Aneurinibacillus sp. Ricciae_BoGa-3]|uniref:hypothetical protein n=1 Tax=Aneurinibacillus sp. Ricciae_BoGa-3 TaxID=3022697 RepID=UPI0023425B4C|nr:hypothetical protein [Aneurinibacillus sp. Ricciae_BoGa-3]WCK54754.1 hypothetical protein PP175_01570 [Aneurinibacillus sp. Ricciae_BoGa-3]